SGAAMVHPRCVIVRLDEPEPNLEPLECGEPTTGGLQIPCTRRRRVWINGYAGRSRSACTIRASSRCVDAPLLCARSAMRRFATRARIGLEPRRIEAGIRVSTDDPMRSATVHWLSKMAHLFQSRKFGG